MDQQQEEHQEGAEQQQPQQQDSVMALNISCSMMMSRRSSDTQTRTSIGGGPIARRSHRIRRSLPARMSSLEASTGKKRVRFDECPKYIESGIIDERDIPRIWFTKNELGSLREDNRITLRALKKADGNVSALDSDLFCLRGLEDSLVGGKEKFQKTRNNIINGILDEQGKQRTMGINDPRGLQVLSRACSKQARERAHERGKSDAEQAKLAMAALSSARRQQRRSPYHHVQQQQQIVEGEGGEEDSKLSDSFQTTTRRTSCGARYRISDEERSGSSARSA